MTSCSPALDKNLLSTFYKVSVLFLWAQSQNANIIKQCESCR